MGAAVLNVGLLLDCGSGSPAPYVLKLQGNKTAAALNNEPGLKGRDIIFQVRADGACKRAAAAASVCSERPRGCRGCWPLLLLFLRTNWTPHLSLAVMKYRDPIQHAATACLF